MYSRYDEPRWFDAHGREVDLDNIDKRYALNIHTMVVGRIYRDNHGYRDHEIGELVKRNPLVQKLREVILTGRSPDPTDRARAVDYNELSERVGIPYRAEVT